MAFQTAPGGASGSPTALLEPPALLEGMLTAGGGTLPALFLAALALALLSRFLKAMLSRRRRDRWRTAPGVNGPYRYGMADPAAQMEAITRVDWSLRPILNRGESSLFALVEEVVAPMPGYRVMAQTSLGELLRVSAAGVDRQVEREAHASINSKRLDISVIGPDGRLALAIEYQGEGHYRGNASMRDAVKREALRRAGIAMIEVTPQDPPELLRRTLVRALQQDDPVVLSAGAAEQAG